MGKFKKFDSSSLVYVVRDFMFFRKDLYVVNVGIVWVYGVVDGGDWGGFLVFYS